MSLRPIVAYDTPTDFLDLVVTAFYERVEIKFKVKPQYLFTA